MRKPIRIGFPNVTNLNRANNWYITESPVIWKEINIWGGKKYLIGGLSEFWEYIMCYYGLESLISKEETEKLAKDNLKFYIADQKTNAPKEAEVTVICILGASDPQTPFLIEELINMECLRKLKGIEFKLSDAQAYDNNTKYLFILDCAKAFNRRRIFGTQNIISIVDNEADAIENCDILIHVEDFSKHETESSDQWLGRCYTQMTILADHINCFAKRSLFVILNNHGPVCFMATCLIEYCTRIQLSNIVAVSADEGLPMVNLVSEKTGIPKDKLGAPPVWGFIGMNSFVDTSHIVCKADICKPYERAAMSTDGSTIPLGEIRRELRLLLYWVPNNNSYYTDVIRERRNMIKLKLSRPHIRSKQRALCTLLKLWFSTDPSDEIISLGVCSNGTFNIPIGIVFSQPVMLNEQHKWIPYSNFPLMNDFTYKKVGQCFDNIRDILVKYGFSRDQQENTGIISDTQI